MNSSKLEGTQLAFWDTTGGWPPHRAAGLHSHCSPDLNGQQTPGPLFFLLGLPLLLLLLLLLEHESRYKEVRAVAPHDLAQEAACPDAAGVGAAPQEKDSAYSC